MRAWPDRAAVARLARESVALSGVDGAFALTQSIPRYFLQIAHGAAAVGYFTALASIGPAVEQLASSIGHAAAPRLGATAANDPIGYRGLVGRLFAVGALIGAALTVGTVFGGRLFLRLAYTADYVDYLPAFVIVMLGAGLALMNALGYFAMVAVRRPGMLLALQCVGMLVTAASGALLIPRFAVTGAALAVGAGRALVTAITAGLLLRRPAEAPR